MPQAPGRYHPVRAKERVTERRNYVLREMWQNGYVDQATYEAEARLPLPAPGPPPTAPAPAAAAGGTASSSSMRFRTISSMLPRRTLVGWHSGMSW